MGYRGDQFEKILIFGIVVDNAAASTISQLIKDELKAKGATTEMIKQPSSYTHLIGLPGLCISAEGAYAEQHDRSWWREEDTTSVGDYVFGFTLRSDDYDEELDNEQIFDRGPSRVHLQAWEKIIQPMLDKIGSFHAPEIFEVTQQTE